jgi:hypothetical protein
MATKEQLEILESVGKFYDDPLGYVMYSFPWDTDPSIQLVKLSSPYKEKFNCVYGPDVWLCEFLDRLGEEIRKRNFDGKNAVDPIMFSTASGHGIGKTAGVSMLIKFILDTRPRSKIVVTACTAPQLQSKTWAELAKWHKISITKDLFSYSSGRDSMGLRSIFDREGWNAIGQTCKEENADSFQGLHAATSTACFIFDEASGIPDKIFLARMGGLTDGEPMVFDFGNPLHNTGMFFENTVGRFKHQYITRQIDSREVSITNKALYAKWAKDWGEDSDYYKVKVKGQFPSVGAAQLISTEDVKRAQERPLIDDHNAPLVIGVDVARFGSDASVLFPRRGADAKSFPFEAYHQLDAVELADKVVEMVKAFRKIGIEYAMIFVDTTGVGGPVLDILKHAGYRVMSVDFGKSSSDNSYLLVGDMIWGRMRDAIRDFLRLPNVSTEPGQRLYDQLTQRLYGFSRSKIKLESKDDMKKRHGSPDESDALACTFFMDIAPVRITEGDNPLKFIDYDPYDTR